MQQRENTIRNIAWHAGEDDNTKGPDTALALLEAATSTWTNVNVIEYEPGVTALYENAFTGCTGNNNDHILICEQNTYTHETLGKRRARARMITALEAESTGCKYNNPRSCPDWMYNYLVSSTQFGGSYDDTTKNEIEYTVAFYWTMSADSQQSSRAFYIRHLGDLYSYYTTGIGKDAPNTGFGARAVVEINK